MQKLRLQCHQDFVVLLADALLQRKPARRSFEGKFVTVVSTESEYKAACKIVIKSSYVVRYALD